MCKSGTQFIHSSLVNDFNCDCTDGSDEQNTGACTDSNLRWTLTSNPLIATVISDKPHSFYLNDGVCDSCNPENEWLNPDLCKNTCLDSIKDDMDQIKTKILNILHYFQQNYSQQALKFYQDVISSRLDQIAQFQQILNQSKTIEEFNTQTNNQFKTFLTNHFHDINQRKLNGIFFAIQPQSKMIDTTLRSSSTRRDQYQKRSSSTSTTTNNNNNNNNNNNKNEEDSSYEPDYFLPQQQPHSNQLLWDCPFISANEFAYELCPMSRTEQFSILDTNSPGVNIGHFHSIQTKADDNTNITSLLSSTNPFAGFKSFNNLQLAELRNHSKKRSEYYFSSNITPSISWLFTQGERCWNGVTRSMKVDLSCGLIPTKKASKSNKPNISTRMFHVLLLSEPKMCQYEAQIVSPLMCEHRDLSALYNQLKTQYNIANNNNNNNNDNNTISQDIQQQMDLIESLLQHQKLSLSSKQQLIMEQTDLKALFVQYDPNYKTLFSRHELHPSIFFSPFDVFQIDLPWIESLNLLRNNFFSKYNQEIPEINTFNQIFHLYNLYIQHRKQNHSKQGKHSEL